MAQGIPLDKEKVLEALKPYFLLGYNRHRACINAGLDPANLAHWEEKDPELSIKIDSWINYTSAKARQVIHEAIIKGDKDTAKWWAERVEKKDFSTRNENINTDANLQDLLNSFEPPEE